MAEAWPGLAARMAEAWWGLLRAACLGLKLACSTVCNLLVEASCGEASVAEASAACLVLCTRRSAPYLEVGDRAVRRAEARLPLLLGQRAHQPERIDDAPPLLARHRAYDACLWVHVDS